MTNVLDWYLGWLTMTSYSEAGAGRPGSWSTLVTWSPHCHTSDTWALTGTWHMASSAPLSLVLHLRCCLVIREIRQYVCHKVSRVTIVTCDIVNSNISLLSDIVLLQGVTTKYVNNNSVPVIWSDPRRTRSGYQEYYFVHDISIYNKSKQSFTWYMPMFMSMNTKM